MKRCRFRKDSSNAAIFGTVATLSAVEKTSVEKSTKGGVISCDASCHLRLSLQCIFHSLTTTTKKIERPHNLSDDGHMNPRYLGINSRFASFREAAGELTESGRKLLLGLVIRTYILLTR